MTLIGWLLTLIIIGSVVLVVLRLVPIYVESFKVDAALESLVRQDSIMDTSRADIVRQLAARMEVDDVDRFDTQEKLKSYLTVEKGEGQVVIRLEYQSVAPLVGNLSLVADWRKEVRRP
jgi:hypothetical protein